MAILLEIENQFGVINNYWRIDEIKANFKTNKAKVVLNGYANKEKLPMQTKEIEIDIDKSFAELAYLEIKKLEEFKNAEDLI